MNSGEDQEEIHLPYGVTFGPLVYIKFISRDDDNDVAVRIMGLVNEIPKDKRSTALEICNGLNSKFRYLKFCVDNDGDFSVEYDFPVKTSDELVGKFAVETFLRIIKILDREYQGIAQALYAEKEDEEEDEAESEEEERLNGLRGLLEEMRRQRALPAEAADGDDEGDAGGEIPSFEAFVDAAADGGDGE
ncbi:MAG: YbjN domain-containing protein [Clostridia bacterium]|nr:YbjN domain-containing protein [Clostridia bacterium]